MLKKTKPYEPTHGYTFLISISLQWRILHENGLYNNILTIFSNLPLLDLIIFSSSYWYMYLHKVLRVWCFYHI